MKRFLRWIVRLMVPAHVDVPYNNQEPVVTPTAATLQPTRPPPPPRPPPSPRPRETLKTAGKKKKYNLSKISYARNYYRRNGSFYDMETDSLIEDLLLLSVLTDFYDDGLIFDKQNPNQEDVIESFDQSPTYSNMSADYVREEPAPERSSYDSDSSDD